MIYDERIKLTIKVSFTYIGAIIGAGFASGQELVQFFAIFNERGIWGTIVAGVLFAVTGSIVLKLVQINGIETYNQFFELIFGKKLSRFIDGIITLFLLTGLAVMLVGSGSLINQILGISQYFGFAITTLVVIIILILGVDGLLSVNLILIPFLIIVAIVICAINIFGNNYINTVTIEIKKGFIGNNWLLASVLYVGYNIVLGVIVLASLGSKAKKASLWGGVWGGICLGVLATLMVKALVGNPEALLTEMPLLVIAQKEHYLLGIVYTLALWIALMTTALANAYSIVNRLRILINIPSIYIIIVVIFMTMPFMAFEFSSLVKTIYPLLGYIGLVIFVGIIYSGMKICFENIRGGKF